MIGRTPNSDLMRKLEVLREQGWQAHKGTIGVSKHRFELNPCASEEVAAAFEAKHGIELPEDYRAFLLEMGNGGAGPYYGILPLDEFDSHQIIDEVPSDYLARQNRIPEEVAPGNDWLEKLSLTEDELFEGTIALAEQGCTYYSLLVVSGPHRGRVLNVDLELNPPMMCADASFSAWYERWLDESIAGLEIVWFGATRGGSLESLVTTLTSDDCEAAMVDAATDLGRHPTLPPAAIEVLVNAAEHESQSVAAAAISALRKSPESAIQGIPSWLLSPHSNIRQAAVWLVSGLISRQLESTCAKRLEPRPTNRLSSVWDAHLKNLGT